MKQCTTGVSEARDGCGEEVGGLQGQKHLGGTDLTPPALGRPSGGAGFGQKSEVGGREGMPQCPGCTNRSGEM